MGPNATASDKFIHDIKMAIAKNYVDNLSEETRKGMRDKAEQGLYPSVTPLGYLNDKESKGIVIDCSRAHLIRDMFERYANGECLRDLGKNLYELGLRSKKSKRVANSMLARMLQNPIYTGDFEWGGKFYSITTLGSSLGCTQLASTVGAPTRTSRYDLTRSPLRLRLTNSTVAGQSPASGPYLDDIVLVRCVKQKRLCTWLCYRRPNAAQKCFVNVWQLMDSGI